MIVARPAWSPPRAARATSRIESPILQSGYGPSHFLRTGRRFPIRRRLVRQHTGTDEPSSGHPPRVASLPGSVVQSLEHNHVMPPRARCARHWFCTSTPALAQLWDGRGRVLRRIFDPSPCACPRPAAHPTSNLGTSRTGSFTPQGSRRTSQRPSGIAMPNGVSSPPCGTVLDPTSSSSWAGEGSARTTSSRGSPVRSRASTTRRRSEPRRSS